MCYEGAFAHRKRGRAPAHHSSRWPRGASAARLFDRRQLLQKVVAGSAKEDAHLIGKAGAQALLAGAPRRFKVSRAYERVERSRSAPRASIILRANCRVVHNRLKMLKLNRFERISRLIGALVQRRQANFDETHPHPEHVKRWIVHIN